MSAAMSLMLRFAARSDVGLIRTNNEDAVYAGPRLVAVADGMGGHAAGDVASAVTIATLAPLDDDDPPSDLLGVLEQSIRQANDQLRQMMDSDAELDGMGTTLTALLWGGTRLALAHIGDSRAYLLRDGELTQITHDHTLVQHMVDLGQLDEADVPTHPQRSVILRVLNGRPDAEADLSIREARAGDRYLLCSDGLSGVVSKETLRETLTVGDPEQVVDSLVDLALRGGAPDNVTCVVCDVIEAGTTAAGSPVIGGSIADGDDVRIRQPDTAAGRAAALRIHRRPAAHRASRRRADPTALARSCPRRRLAAGRRRRTLRRHVVVLPASVLCRQRRSAGRGLQGHRRFGTRPQLLQPHRAHRHRDVVVAGVRTRARRCRHRCPQQDGRRSHRRSAAFRSVGLTDAATHPVERAVRSSLVGSTLCRPGRIRAGWQRTSYSGELTMTATAGSTGLIGAMKPRRPRTRRAVELAMLVFAVIIALAAYADVGLTRSQHVPPDILTYGLGLGALVLLAHIAIRRFAAYADPLLLPCAALLNGLGLVLIHRLDLVAPKAARADATLQLAWSAIGVVGFIAVLVIVRDHRRLQRFTYTSMLLGLVLLAIPSILPARFSEVNGARNWIRFAGFSIQPGEFAKVLLVIFVAGFLVAKRDALALAGRRIVGIDLPRGRDLGSCRAWPGWSASDCSCAAATSACRCCSSASSS